jgi:hypothetical protein
MIYMQQTRLTYLIVSVLVLILGGGCALSKQECLRGDWYGIGYKDGSRGKEYDRLLDHEKTCAKYGVLPNEAFYRRGRDKGLVVYCSEQNGYEMGNDIDKYNGVCPPEFEQMFLQGYLRGLGVAEDEVHWEITQKSRELAENALSLSDLKGKEYERQKKKIVQLKSNLERLDDKLYNIKKLRRQHGWKVR